MTFLSAKAKHIGTYQQRHIHDPPPELNEEAKQKRAGRRTEARTPASSQSCAGCRQMRDRKKAPRDR